VTAWALIVGSALVLVLPLAWRARRGRFDPFEPIVLFALAWGAMFVVRPTAMLVRDERSFWGLDVQPTLPRALLLAQVGAVAFVVGYQLLPARYLAARLPTPRPVDSSIAAAAALVACVIAIVAVALFLPLSDGLDALRILVGGRSAEFGEVLSGSSTYIVNASLLVAPAALVLTALAIRRPSSPLVVAASLALVLALVRLLPTGGRIVLLPLLGGIFVFVFVIRDRRPRAAALVALGILALVASYFTLHFRDPTDDQTVETAVEELADRPHAIFDPVISSADAEMVLALSAALTVIPDELPHRWGGATAGNLATRPVPRELWPGKPRPPGQVVVATVWPHLYPGFDPAFTPLLVLYWDFGIAGVAAGMALFGLLCRLLYEWFLLHRRAFAAQLVFAASLWFVVVGARNDPVDTLVLATFLIAPLVAIVAVASEGVLPVRIRGALSGSVERPPTRHSRETS
jgi:hypothetical protein